MPQRRRFNRVALHRSSRRPTARLYLEALEERSLLSGLVVTKMSPDDGGIGSGVSASVRAWFNRPVDRDSVEANFTVVRVGSTDAEPGRTSVLGLYSAPPGTEPACGHPDFPYECTATFDRVALGAAPDPLDYETTYRATLKGGPLGVRSQDDEHFLDADVTWTFTTARDPELGTEDYSTADVPILIVTSETTPFSYYSELLRADGLNAFTTCAIEEEAAEPCDLDTLARFDVVLLAAPLGPGQYLSFIDYVEAGGNLIAMQPWEPQFRAFFGLGVPEFSLRDRYLQVLNVGPGAGIEHSTMKYHGWADSSAVLTPDVTVIAQLCSSEDDCSTMAPAVTVREVGAGKAAAFNYDLALSVVLTRQGDPEAAGSDRICRQLTDDSLKRNLLTAYEMFVPPYQGPPYPGCDNYDNLADPALYWNDMRKAAIPQADEQTRLLANLIGFMNLDNKPLPRLWYLPSYYDGEGTGAIVQKAAVVMTGDDHVDEFSGTVERFQIHRDEIPVSGGKPVRSTSYIDCYIQPDDDCNSDTAPSDSSLATHLAQGFEVALHPARNGGVEGLVPPDYEEFFSSQLRLWRQRYESAPMPSTNRTDGVEWYDYDTQPQVEFDHRMRFDTNYYYWVEAWKEDFAPDFLYPGLYPGTFTGSHMPLRFAKQNGQLIDVYQVLTQMTDQSQQCYSFNEDLESCNRYDGTEKNTIEHLLEAAFNPAKGYYGVFTVNAHTDNNFDCNHPRGGEFSQLCTSRKVIARSKVHETPVHSSREMLEWLDGRNGSAFRRVRWANNNLQFDIAAAVGSEHTQAMVPTCSGNGLRLQVVLDSMLGDRILTRETIKGVEYAFFWAEDDSYVASYGPGNCTGGGSLQSATSPGTSSLDPAMALVGSGAEAFDTPAPWETSTQFSSPADSAIGLATETPPAESLPSVFLSHGVEAAEELTVSALPTIPTEPSVALLDALFADVAAALLLDDLASENVAPVL